MPLDEFLVREEKLKKNICVILTVLLLGVIYGFEIIPIAPVPVAGSTDPSIESLPFLVPIQPLGDVSTIGLSAACKEIVAARRSIDSLYAGYEDYFADYARDNNLNVGPKSQFESSVDYYKRMAVSLRVFSDYYNSQIKPLRDKLDALLRRKLTYNLSPKWFKFTSYDADEQKCYFETDEWCIKRTATCTIHSLNGSYAKKIVENMEDLVLRVEYRTNIEDEFYLVCVWIDASKVIPGLSSLCAVADWQLQTFQRPGRDTFQLLKFNDSGNFIIMSSYGPDFTHFRDLRNVNDLISWNTMFKGVSGRFFSNWRSNWINISNDGRYFGNGSVAGDLTTCIYSLKRPVGNQDQYLYDKLIYGHDDTYGIHSFIVFSPDSHYALVGGRWTILYDIKANQELAEFEIEGLNAVWSSDGKRFIIQTEDNVQVFDALTLERIQTYNKAADFCSISSDGKWLMISNKNNAERNHSDYKFINLLNEQTAPITVTLPIYPWEGYSQNVDFIKDRYAICVGDPELYVWDSYNKSQLIPVKEWFELDHRCGITDFMISPSGNTIIDQDGVEYFLFLDWLQ